ncbi:hypothetical protein BVC93_14205 [Mycobacterium sp. MS1601]|uniref:class I adenylate-forming enzyme family protein n=1 Tax=Mycobacterium sp. MS1601 TaxID=1936029 RepID=UPI0009797017|nr:class I adenylate-forming enzyme family protein [Mycobacterium sp. MS1601]AQA03376.1 hypothetical protein BVC93_14205 [Mycobacterium sp. MS1601]
MDGDAFLRNLTPMLSRAGGQTLVDDTNLSLTGIELLQHISALKEMLRPRLQPGDVVAVALRSSVAYLVLQAALVDLGAVFVGVPTDAPYLLDDVRTRCEPRWYALAPGSEFAEAARSDAGLLLVDERTASVSVAWAPRERSGVSDLADGRVVAATSGSTGQPKLVVLSPESYWFAATSIGRVTGIRASDSVLHHLPIQRGAGWLLWGSVAAGAHNLILPTRTTELPNALRDNSITATFSVSVGLAEMVKQDYSAESLPDLRTLYYSSGPVTVDLKRALAERFGDRLIQDYGMTEVPEPVTVLTREDHVRGLDNPTLLSSVGKPLHPNRISVESGAGPSEPGGIRVRSPYMFEGYWGQPLQTVERWYDTGDLGYFDTEGGLHIVGRRSESVRSGGVSFSLNDIRSHIMSVQGVEDVDLSVLPDDRLGERVRASVVVSAGSGLDAGSLTDHLRSVVEDSRAIPSEIHLSTTATSFEERNH